MAVRAGGRPQGGGLLSGSVPHREGGSRPTVPGSSFDHQQAIIRPLSQKAHLDKIRKKN